MSRVVLDHVTKRFGDTVAVDDLSIEIEAGEFFCLLGPSGCGKTSTMRCITGLEQPEGGRIVIGDRVVSDARDLSFVPPPDRRIGMVFQNYALWPHMTVERNITFGLRIRRLPRREQERRLAEVMELLQIQGLEARYPSELSGGQQQRVALARELVTGSDVLVFDEPLSNLDAQLRVDMRFELKRLHQETGRTFIYVTHDQIEALTLSTQMAVLRDGRVSQIGAPDEVFDRPESLFVATFLGSGSVGINVLSMRIVGDALEGAGLRLPRPPLPPDGTPSGELTLAVRPEALQILPEPVDAWCVPCTIETEVTMGHVSLLSLIPNAAVEPDAPRLKAVADRRRRVVRGAGTTCWVRFPEDELHLFHPLTSERLLGADNVPGVGDAMDEAVRQLGVRPTKGGDNTEER
jgi:iron(III) transport system ATP-binding protein